MRLSCRSLVISAGEIFLEVSLAGDQSATSLIFERTAFFVPIEDRVPWTPTGKAPATHMPHHADIKAPGGWPVRGLLLDTRVSQTCLINRKCGLILAGALQDARAMG